MTLPHFTTGSATAAQLDAIVDQVNGNTTSLATLSPLSGRTGCRLRRAANQSVATGSTVSISWDTEDQDAGGFIAAPGTTITVPTGGDGLYAITYRAAGLVTGTRFVGMLAVTSSLTGYPSPDFRAVSNSTEQAVVVALAGVPLVGGDSLQAQVFHNSAGAINFTAWLTMFRTGL